MADAPAEAMDASLMMATHRGDCQKLKDLIIQRDATTMIVVVASSNQESKEKSSVASMHPLLAAAACRGNLEELKFLLNRGSLPRHEFRDQLEAYYPGNSSSSRSLPMKRAADHIEEGTHADAASILEGVTMEGDTAMHLLAANMHGDNFMNCADLIYHEDKAFLYKQNYSGDTPLHCAARTGNCQMISHLIDLARGENRVEYLLRKENNSNETALHEAVRIGDNEIVKELLVADPKLARFPEQGPSPLYLAILLEEGSIARTLYDNSTDNAPSFSGPHGQNPLHAAVTGSTDMVKMLLEWNKRLASEVDCNGSTPLHFLSSRRNATSVPRTFLGFPFSRPSPLPTGLLLHANQAALFQPDNRGVFPIHVAACVGADETITRFIKYCPGSVGLRDRRGRTFLHTAAENSGWKIVAFACRTPLLAWILNLQDADGNTALHMAIQAGCLRSFCALLGNHQVHLNVANKKGQTPLDMSRINAPQGIYYNQNNRAHIHRALSFCGARYGGCRWDHFRETYINEKEKDGQRNEQLDKNLKDSTQSLCITSVLIATVAFGATFALPGGYRSDDSTNGGTPTLAGRYSFDAFIIATTLAFICSMIGTTGLMFSGLTMVDLNIRVLYLVVSGYLVSSSVTSLAAAFHLGVYVVLAPIAHKSAVAICVMSPLVVICTLLEFCVKLDVLARSLFSRIGLIPALIIISRAIIERLLFYYWPLVLIFCWPAVARNH